MRHTEQESVHFIGVGGVGMSGIARVAHDQGMRRDRARTSRRAATPSSCSDAGVTVFIGQDGREHPRRRRPTVVVSTAILENNPELIEARRRNLPIVHRAQMLARLGRDLDTLAVAGTHGKTHDVFHARQHAGRHGLRSHLPHRRHRAGLRHQRPFRAAAAPTWWRPTSPTSPSPTSPRRRPSSRTSRRITWTTTRDLEEIYAQFAAFLSGVREGGAIVVCGDDPKLGGSGPRHRAHRDHLRLFRGLRRPHPGHGGPGRGHPLHPAATRRARGGQPHQAEPGPATTSPMVPRC